MTFDLILFLCLGVSLIQVDAALEPTKLINNNVYRLASQHDGRYLTDGGNGVPTRAQGSTENPSQKFTFINTSERNNVWKLESLSSGTPLSGTSFQVSYVGHGKYQFKNVKTGMCLQGSGTPEGVCGKQNPMQRWFVEPAGN